MLPFLHRITPATMEENPLWLVVLCDMMTNLMLFFLVMFAVSLQGPKAKAAFEQAFRTETAVRPGPPTSLPAPPLEPERALRAALAAAGLAGQVQLQKTETGVRLRLREEMLFEFGHADLDPGAARPLAVIARALAPSAYEVVVEGYTDDRPVTGGPYRSNWELSVARSYAVLQRLQLEGMPPTRLVAAGYGPFHPLASNATAEGRARNRRVELLVVKPEEGL
ncbi:MAG: OmpA family protein [Elusimicrobia bacterium]|nr:OmpA family protein [Elusimicrobiota bacterium]